MSFAFPALGSRPTGEISPREVLTVLKEVELRGIHETARKLRTAIGDVFRYAIATARAENDPTIALRGALVTPTVTSRAAIVAPKAFGGLLRAIEDYQGALETRAALELLALTFVRPGELRAAEWAEFDLGAAVWEVPGGRMKMRKPHRVPLAWRVVTILNELRKLTGQGRFLFPSARSVARCMSENTLNAALRRGFKNEDMTSHGFRASESSMLNESGLWNADAIERQLAHVDGDSVRRAYARAEFWDERVKMMSWWAERCEELRRGKNDGRQASPFRPRCGPERISEGAPACQAELPAGRILLPELSGAQTAGRRFGRLPSAHALSRLPVRYLPDVRKQMYRAVSFNAISQKSGGFDVAFRRGNNA